MKKIFFAAAAIAASLSVVSCEDMLSPDSEMVVYQEDHTISSVNDTLFSVMGVVHLMQKVADRTNLLGEVRADLVTVTPAATTDLQDLSANLVQPGNAYNHPEDFYAIINNCNYYIQYADTAYVKNGQKVFERELAVMHTYRAWAYLQLATTYGEIPFYTDFLGTQVAAEEVMRQPRQDLKTICNWLIDDLRPFELTYALNYGAVGPHLSAKFFIPVRIMLGELCLWAERYSEAAQYYHDYITDKDNPLPLGIRSANWGTDSKPATWTYNGYSTSFDATDDQTITYIPMEGNSFDGLISDLYELYNSTRDNYYYYQLGWSEAVLNLSARQKYYYVYEENNVKDTVSMAVDSVYSKLPMLRRGDLRLDAVCNNSSVHGVIDGVEVNENYQTIRKFRTTDNVILYRLPIIYLHYAEALNRAGYPTSAFALLKYGLCDETTKEREKGDPIHPTERETAGTLLYFDELVFKRSNTKGFHARGCGDVDANPEYVMPMPASELPSYADSVAYQIPMVEDLIVEELALENCFEGQRFYDLLRVALRRNDMAYLADRVAQRNGAVDETLKSRLMQKQNCFMPLP